MAACHSQLRTKVATLSFIQSRFPMLEVQEDSHTRSTLHVHHHIELVVPGETAKSALCLIPLPKRARHPTNTSGTPPRRHLALFSTQSIQHSLSQTPAPIEDIPPFFQRSLSTSLTSIPSVTLGITTATLSSARALRSISGRKGRGHRRPHQNDICSAHHSCCSMEGRYR